MKSPESSEGETKKPHFLRLGAEEGEPINEELRQRMLDEIEQIKTITRNVTLEVLLTALKENNAQTFEELQLMGKVPMLEKISSAVDAEVKMHDFPAMREWFGSENKTEVDTEEGNIPSSKNISDR